MRKIKPITVNKKTEAVFPVHPNMEFDNGLLKIEAETRKKESEKSSEICWLALIVWLLWIEYAHYNIILDFIVLNIFEICSRSNRLKRKRIKRKLDRKNTLYRQCVQLNDQIWQCDTLNLYEWSQSLYHALCTRVIFALSRRPLLPDSSSYFVSSQPLISFPFYQSCLGLLCLVFSLFCVVRGRPEVFFLSSNDKNELCVCVCERVCVCLQIGWRSIKNHSSPDQFKRLLLLLLMLLTRSFRLCLSSIVFFFIPHLVCIFLFNTTFFDAIVSMRSHLCRHMDHGIWPLFSFSFFFYFICYHTLK